MSRVISRICIVLIFAIITLAGTKVLATCIVGCNFGYQYGPCQGYEVYHDCPSTDMCEVDHCNGHRMRYSVNEFDFWQFSPDYLCHYPSCSWNANCGCDN